MTRELLSLHLVHVSNQVRSLLLLLDACKDHLGSRNVLLRVQQILEQVLVRPQDGSILVRFRVRKPITGAGSAANEAPERRALLDVATLLDCVALSTLGLEELCTLLGVTRRHLHVRLWHRHCTGNHGPMTEVCNLWP